MKILAKCSPDWTDACPQIIDREDGSGNVVVIGKRADAGIKAELGNRIGDDEYAVVIPAHIVEEAMKSRPG